MDLRDGGDNQEEAHEQLVAGGDNKEEAHELVAGGEESSEEYASLALSSDNDGECAEASTGESATCGCLVVVSGDSGCEEATSPAVVSGDSGGVLAIAAEVDVESEGHEEDDNEEEKEGYVTPTSPRHRLRAPVVCPPPPPRPRRALTTAAAGPRGRKRICAELDLGRGWSDSAVTRGLLFVDADADELFSAFVKRRQLAAKLH
ncbi:hypothetical protein GUJ93_ZPchr0009g2352 [Zizania palustris]|uniref:Uncharacterized protein n=1 Tax=Zizania palustris TaxID=103762 RepID=A0A8J5V688_ZIZPA|nr:hypothetical protein GUJ93_ZPchr0009g2352 [Zizania palustris]